MKSAEEKKSEQRVRSQKHYFANREKILARNHEHYRDNKEHILRQCREYRLQNRERIAAQKKARYQEHKTKILASNLRSARKRRYGVSSTAFDSMLMIQQEACGICQRPFSKTPHVDHCHATGKVRGLLCYKCNVGLGSLNDDPALLLRAVRYLQLWSETFK